MIIKFRSHGVSWKDGGSTPYNRHNPQIVPSITELQGILCRIYCKPEYVYKIKRFGYIKAPNDTITTTKNICNTATTAETFDSTLGYVSGWVRNGDCVEFWVDANIVPIHLKEKDGTQRSVRHMINKHANILSRNVRNMNVRGKIYAGDTTYEITHMKVTKSLNLDQNPFYLCMHNLLDVSAFIRRDNNGTPVELIETRAELQDGIVTYESQHAFDECPEILDYSYNKHQQLIKNYK